VSTAAAFDAAPYGGGARNCDALVSTNGATVFVPPRGVGEASGAEEVEPRRVKREREPVVAGVGAGRVRRNAAACHTIVGSVRENRGSHTSPEGDAIRQPVAARESRDLPRIPCIHGRLRSRRRADDRVVRRLEHGGRGVGVRHERAVSA
jgi:hypothetical protein